MTLKNPDRLLTKAGDSKLGALVIGQRGNELWAICAPCGYVVGWSFTDGIRPDPDSEGYWSCHEGCQTKYKNPLGITTSSVLELTDTGYPRSAAVSVREWVAGWLGRAEWDTDFEVLVTTDLGHPV